LPSVHTILKDDPDDQVHPMNQQSFWTMHSHEWDSEQPMKSKMNADLPSRNNQCGQNCDCFATMLTPLGSVISVQKTQTLSISANSDQTA
jgi:hypothetical protein